MTKKLVVAADRYDARWAVGDTRVSGSVDLRAGRRPLCGLFEAPGSMGENGKGSHFPAKVEDAPDVLRGRLMTNHVVVLTGVKMEHTFPGRTKVTADTALVGGEVPDDLLFESVDFQVGGLTELATVRPLGEVQFPRELHTGSTFMATWGKDSTQRWTTADGDMIELEFTASISHQAWYAYGVSTSPVVRVKGAPRPVEEWMSRYVLPLAEIATLATERQQPVCWVQVRPAKDRDQWPVQVFSADIDDQAAYEASEPDMKLMVSDLHASLIPLGPDGVDLAEVLTRWHTLRDEHHTFHEYLTLRHREATMSARARMLAAVPALEGLHDAVHGKPPPGRAEQLRNEVFNRVRVLPGLTAHDLDYLDKRLAPPEGYKLAFRLGALADHDLSVDLRALITKRTDPLPPVLVLDGIDGRQTVWEAMGTVRNRIAHGTTPVPTIEQIQAVMRLAHTMATAIALGRLGVSDAALRAGIEHDRWQIF